MKTQSLLVLGLILLGLLLPAAAFAEEEAEKKSDQEQAYLLEPITVTADKHEENVQNIPASISVITGQQLEDYGISQTSDIFQQTPNLFMVKTTSSKAGVASFTAIRGITGFMGSNSAVGFYVDDVYYPGFEVNLLDVERVEILKGPQGTLYGRNTEAGVINVLTKQATNEWTAKVGLGYGTYNTKNVKLTTGGALVDDTLYLRLAGSFMQTDGFFYNNYDESHRVDKQDEGDGRLSLRWTPTSKWDVSLITDFQYDNGNYAEFAPLDQIKDNPHEVDVDYEGLAKKSAVGSALRASYDLGDIKLLSVTAYRDEDYKLNNDVDFSSADNTRLYIDQRNSLGSQEFRVYSDDKDAAFQWLGGIYLFRERVDQDLLSDMRNYNIEFSQSGDTETTGGALFGQASYTFWKSLKFTAGLRYDREHKDFDYKWTGGTALGIADVDGSNDKDFEAWLPKFALSYQITDELMPYVSVSRGYKSGGFNIKTEPGDAYDSEYTWSYEAGLKSEWLDKRLQVNMAAFLIKWDDMQVEIPDSIGLDYTIVNAGKATSQGLEFELKARPLQGWEITGGMGFTRAVFDEYIRDGEDMSGNRVPNVPGFSAQIGSSYHFSNGLFASADYQRTGSMHWDAENTKKQGAYQTVNAKLGYEGEHYELYLWGKNLFDAVYVTRAFKMNNTWYGRAGDPMTFGIGGALRF